MCRTTNLQEIPTQVFNPTCLEPATRTPKLRFRDITHMIKKLFKRATEVSCYLDQFNRLMIQSALDNYNG